MITGYGCILPGTQNSIGIRGPVAGLLHVSDRCAVAIETALGGAMQNLVVDTDENGKNAISFLKQVQTMEDCPPRLKAELYSLLETASRETGNYKEAYEYATKLMNMQLHVLLLYQHLYIVFPFFL